MRDAISVTGSVKTFGATRASDGLALVVAGAGEVHRPPTLEESFLRCYGRPGGSDGRHAGATP
ncbi:hypothetical protein ACFYSC_30985 [Streptosporangium sp. NPDC004379]|uniref:hypothetical protein n=1 Tax=Streptosporangium sp. NPDC004379 TaxID=3366189 RepID=UPI00368B14C8